MRDFKTCIFKPIFAGLIILLVEFTVAEPARSGQPFIRELATGYPLQCSFLSPRQYCWTSENTVMLSGW